MLVQLKEARQTTWDMLEIMGHCIWQSVRHPGKIITQVSNPVPIQMSPIPWWGCTGLILVGIASWIASACLQITELREASRALVYFPLMHLFDMGYYTSKKVHKPEKKK
jgi:hypothetical protein